MMRLKSVENNQVQLEVFECDCGFHLGLDATYLDQEDDLTVLCPQCETGVFDTKKLAPEGHKTYTVKTVRKIATITLTDEMGVELNPFKVKSGNSLNVILDSLNNAVTQQKKQQKRPHNGTSFLLTQKKHLKNP